MRGEGRLRAARGRGGADDAGAGADLLNSATHRASAYVVPLPQLPPPPRGRVSAVCEYLGGNPPQDHEKIRKDTKRFSCPYLFMVLCEYPGGNPPHATRIEASARERASSERRSTRFVPLTRWFTLGPTDPYSPPPPPTTTVVTPPPSNVRVVRVTPSPSVAHLAGCGPSIDSVSFYVSFHVSFYVSFYVSLYADGVFLSAACAAHPT